jgi:two-component system chemotaxis response regulator CheY
MSTFLVVDDSQVIRKVAKRILTDHGFDVVEGESAAGAIEVCKGAMPDVVLLDWMMPGLSSLEALAEIRQLPGGDGVFIIYCTTENDPVDLTRAFNAGADDYLLKPFDRAALESKLAEIKIAA